LECSAIAKVEDDAVWHFLSFQIRRKGREKLVHVEAFDGAVHALGAG
jgi:hypothetical protein